MVGKGHIPVQNAALPVKQNNNWMNTEGNIREKKHTAAHFVEQDLPTEMA